MAEILGIPPLPQTEDVKVIANYLRQLTEFVARQSKSPSSAVMAGIDTDTAARIQELETAVTSLKQRVTALEANSSGTV